MRNLTGSTKYAPVSSSEEGADGGVNVINTTATKANVLTGQVSRLVDGVFPVTSNISNNMNLSTLDTLASKSAALKSVFRSSTNSCSSQYHPQIILNHHNLPTMIPGIGGYQYEAVDKQHYNGENYQKETVEAKWEQLQDYESSQWQNNRHSQNSSDAAFSSIASSGASSTASSSSSSKAEASSLGSSVSVTKPADAAQSHNDENLAPPTFVPPPPSTASSARRKFQEMKRQSMKKLSSLKSQITGGGNSSAGSGTKFKSTSSTNMNSRAMSSYGVSAAPDGPAYEETERRGVLSRIRASKSMQNLDQITRDSYFNLRDKTSNLKAIYSSRLELRAEKPSSQYDELSDEDDDLGAVDAGSDSDNDSGVGHTYDNLRKANTRRMNPIQARFTRAGF